MIKKVFFSFKANIVIALLNLIITVLTAKFLGATGRGELTLIVTYIAFIQIVNEISGVSSIYYMLNKFRVSEIASVSSIWFFIISTAGTSLLVLLKAIDVDIAQIVFLSTFLFALLNLLVKIILNKINLTWYNSLTILQPLIIVTLISISGFSNLSVKSYLLFQLYAYAGLLLVSIFLLHKHFKRVRVRKIKSLVFESFKLGFINQAANFSQNLNYRLSYLFLQKFWGVNSVGVFSIVLSVINVIWLFSSTVSTLLNNEVTKTSSSEERVKLTVSSMYLTLLMTTGVLIVFLLIPTSFYVLLLNKEFFDLKKLVLIMTPAIIIYSLTRVISHYFSGIGLMKYNLMSSFIGLLVTISVAPYLIREHNLVGSAISNSLSYIFSAIVLFYFFKLRRDHLNK